MHDYLYDVLLDKEFDIKQLSEKLREGKHIPWNEIEETIAISDNVWFDEPAGKYAEMCRNVIEHKNVNAIPKLATFLREVIEAAAKVDHEIIERIKASLK